uniref:Uncharacterized protein n=1 Tax=Ditylenchus dipsaci TaxID=166011 RepID=A0A915D3I3_9BILA
MLDVTEIDGLLGFAEKRSEKDVSEKKRKLSSKAIDRLKLLNVKEINRPLCSASIRKNGSEKDRKRTFLKKKRKLASKPIDELKFLDVKKLKVHLALLVIKKIDLSEKDRKRTLLKKKKALGELIDEIKLLDVTEKLMVHQALLLFEWMALRNNLWHGFQ